MVEHQLQYESDDDDIIAVQEHKGESLIAVEHEESQVFSPSQKPIPQRRHRRRPQQQQARLQAAQMARMASATNEASESNVFKRRRSSKKSIWNLAMDPKSEEAIKKSQEESISHSNHLPTCSCGSKDVENFGNVTSRNQDMRKGETWGMKDRGDDVITRYQCNQCGKTWNEEE